MKVRAGNFFSSFSSMYHGMHFRKVNVALFYHYLTNMIYQGYMPFGMCFVFLKLLSFNIYINNPRHALWKFIRGSFCLRHLNPVSIDISRCHFKDFILKEKEYAFQKLLYVPKIIIFLLCSGFLKVYSK